MNWLITAIAICIVLVIAIVVNEVHEENEFMQECTKEHKQYECTAMWRAGNSHTYPVIVPASR